MTYLPNALNAYDTYTYNLKMFMIRPEGITNFEKELNVDDSVLIVDNAGQSKYNMNSLEQQYVVGHNKVRNTFANTFTIMIAEPNGVTLLDTIRRAANKLGIVNHQHAMYIIQIEFNGRVESGAVRKHNQVFYYPVTIIDFQFKVDAGGANYNIMAIENSTNAYSYLNNVIKDQITIESDTVGNFFDQLISVANQSAKDIIVYSVDQLYADSVSFDFDDSISDWRDWKFQALTDENIQGHVNIISAGAGGSDKLQITVNNGTNITDLVTTVLGLTVEYKNILLHGNKKYGRLNPHEDATYTLDQFPVFHKILANVTYGDYDILRGMYTKHMEYKIVPYVVADEIISPLSYLKSITDARIQANRVQNLIDSNLLRKRYDYIYTGKNTEVIEFDIKIDRAYYAVTPYGGGKLGDADTLAPVRADSPITALGQLVADTARQKQVISSLEAKQASSTRQVTRSTNSHVKQLLGSAGAALDVSIKAARTDFRNTVSTFMTNLTDNGISPEDISVMMRFASDVINDDDASGSDNSNKGGKLKFGAVQVNLDNAADLITIELGIRGDPYWMGRPNSFYESSLSADDTLADYERGTNGFFLRCALPTPVEDADGRRKPNVEYEISGYYTVRDVISKFANGQFTMYLNAVRDLGTNTAVAIDALDRASSNKTGVGATTEVASLDAATAAENARKLTKPTRSPHVPAVVPTTRQIGPQ
jgi:hypothetical protein